MIMKTLWVFGDSFSVDFENNNIENFINYKEFKGYHPKSWGKILSEHLNCVYRNHSLGGCDNYTILETFCKYMTEIKPDDYVFVGWSTAERIRLVGNDGKWYVFNRTLPVDEWHGMNGNLINNLLMNRIDDLSYLPQRVVLDEIKSWDNMIKHTMKDMKLHIWKWYNLGPLGEKYETIIQETKGTIDDNHWSEKGHVDYANDLLTLPILKGFI